MMTTLALLVLLVAGGGQTQEVPNALQTQEVPNALQTQEVPNALQTQEVPNVLQIGQNTEERQRVPLCGEGRRFFSNYMKCDASFDYCYEYRDESCVGFENWLCVHHLNRRAGWNLAQTGVYIKNAGLGNTRCCGGQFQSPINIETDEAECFRGPPLRYLNPTQSVFGSFFNKGYHPSFYVSERAYRTPLQLSGVPYTCVVPGSDLYYFKSVHMHSSYDNNTDRSDHWVNGRTYDGEMHLIHVRGDFWKPGQPPDLRCASQTPMGLLVVAVFVSVYEGQPNQEFNRLFSRRFLSRIRESHVACPYTRICRGAQDSFGPYSGSEGEFCRPIPNREVRDVANNRKRRRQKETFGLDPKRRPTPDELVVTDGKRQRLRRDSHTPGEFNTTLMSKTQVAHDNGESITIGGDLGRTESGRAIAVGGEFGPLQNNTKSFGSQSWWAENDTVGDGGGEGSEEIDVHSWGWDTTSNHTVTEGQLWDHMGNNSFTPPPINPIDSQTFVDSTIGSQTFVDSPIESQTLFDSPIESQTFVDSFIGGNSQTGSDNYNTNSGGSENDGSHSGGSQIHGTIPSGGENVVVSPAGRPDGGAYHVASKEGWAGGGETINIIPLGKSRIMDKYHTTKLKTKDVHQGENMDYGQGVIPLDYEENVEDYISSEEDSEEEEEEEYPIVVEEENASVEEQYKEQFLDSRLYHPPNAPASVMGRLENEEGREGGEGEGEEVRWGDEDRQARRVVCYCKRRRYQESFLWWAGRGEEAQCRMKYEFGTPVLSDDPYHLHSDPTMHRANDASSIPLTIRPGQLLPENKAYYQYFGSLTTPPCSEVVNWIILKEPIRITQEQVFYLQQLESRRPGVLVSQFGDVRPVQPLNGRTITTNTCPE